MRRQIFAYLFSVLVCLAFSAAGASAAPLNNVDWQSLTITVKGIGVAPPDAINAVQGTMMARRTALMDGYRQLAEVIKGVQVTSESTAENFILQSDVMSTKIDAVIQGAQVIAEEAVTGGYEVTMCVPMFGETGSVASALLPTSAPRESFPEPLQSVAPSMPVYDTSASVSVRIDMTAKETPVAAPTSDAIGGYTGLIVDCRGLGIRPVMSPVIKNDEGEPIYGHKNLDSHYVIANGMASYTTDIEGAGTKRAGANPLVVKAVSLENHNGNPVISVADANRVLIENKATGFLEKTNVVFVR